MPLKTSYRMFTSYLAIRQFFWPANLFCDSIEG